MQPPYLFTTRRSRAQALLGATESLSRALSSLQSSLQDHRAPKPVAGSTAIIDALIAFTEQLGEVFGVRVECSPPITEVDDVTQTVVTVAPLPSQAQERAE